MSIKRDLARGTFYLAIAKYSGILVSLAVTAILSRILTPEDYGIVAVSYVFIAFFNILSDIGIGPAVIQNKNLNSDDLDNIFTVTVYSGLILGAVFFLSAGLIADYYSDELLISICRLLSFSIFFYCINIVPTNLLYRDKNFRYVSFSSFGVQAVLGAISVFAAYNGVGIYSLLIAPILSPLFLFVLYNSQTRLKYRVHCQFSSLKKILSFSIYQFLFNLVNYFSRNTDKLLLGKYVGLAPLGQYEKSYRLMLLPLQNITFVVTPVMHPIFSDFQNDLWTLGQKYCKVVNLLGYIGFPLSAILFFVSKPLILIFFGDQWLPAVEPFEILSFSVGIQIITSTTASIFQAANSTKQLFHTSVLVAICMVGSFVVAACYFKSIVAMAYAFLFAKTLDMLISYTSLMYIIKFPVKRIWMSMIRPIAVGIVTFVTLYVFNRCVNVDNNFISLISNTCIGAFISAALCERFGDIKVIASIKEIIRGRKID